MKEATRLAIEALRPAKLTVDAQTFEMVKESVKAVYGYVWPEGVGFEEGCRLLFEERIAYWDDRIRRGNDQQGASRPA